MYDSGTRPQDPVFKYMAVSQKKGPHFGSPYNKDHNIFGFILGPPIYGSPHIPFERAIETLQKSYANPAVAAAVSLAAPGFTGLRLGCKPRTSLPALLTEPNMSYSSDMPEIMIWDLHITEGVFLN